MGLEYPWILVSPEVLRPVLYGYQGTTDAIAQTLEQSKFTVLFVAEVIVNISPVPKLLPHLLKTV